MLSGLNLQQRKQMFSRVSDDTLAGILVVMAPAERQKLLTELQQSQPDSAERVVEYIRYHVLKRLFAAPRHCMTGCFA